MDKLLVTPSEVNEKAKEVTNIKETMLTHLESIKTRIQNLTESDWVGAAGVAYQNQFTHLYNQAIIALDTLQQHANNLSSAANSYAELESTQVSEAQSLDASSIFSK